MEPVVHLTGLGRVDQDDGRGCQPSRRRPRRSAAFSCTAIHSAQGQLTAV